MTQSSKPTQVLNFIAVTGFVVALIAIPFCPLCILQLVALVISLVGYFDAKKCNNKGKTLGLLGIIISSILIFIGPFMLYLMLKGLLEFALVYDLTDITSFLNALGVVLKYLVILF